MKKEFDLNVLAAPQFTVTLPSCGTDIKLRSLLMKEYKNLFIAKEGGSNLDAVEQALGNAVQSDIDVLSLPVGDLEFIFLQLYMASTGNKLIPIKYKCQVETDGKSCNTQIDTRIDIESAFVPQNDVDLKVVVNDRVVIFMRHPNSRDFEKHDIQSEKGLFNCVLECVESVYQDDECYTKEELGDVMTGILDMTTGAVFAKLVQVITETSRVTSYVDAKCPKCGTEHKTPVIGLDDFFM